MRDRNYDSLYEEMLKAKAQVYDLSNKYAEPTNKELKADIVDLRKQMTKLMRDNIELVKKYGSVLRFLKENNIEYKQTAVKTEKEVAGGKS